MQNVQMLHCFSQQTHSAAVRLIVGVAAAAHTSKNANRKEKERHMRDHEQKKGSFNRAQKPQMEIGPPSLAAVQSQQQEEKRLPAYLQQHVSWFYPPVSGHRPSFHDGADVDAAVSAVVTLTHNADAQKVVLFCHQREAK